jgi:HAD superfamily hydrolase (TIGR01549 family)
MIKAVIFDFGQTLVDSSNGFRSAEKQAQRAIFKDLGLTSWDDFIHQYREVRTRFKGMSNFSRIAMWKEVYAFHGHNCDEKILKKWENAYWEEVKNGTKLFPEVLSVLEKLSSKYDLAVITNTEGQTDYDEHRINRFPRLLKFFKTIVIAGESGVPPKPDPKPFQICLDNLGLDKKQVVFVGDDWHIDIQGANSFGVSAIWLKHHSVPRKWPTVNTAVPVIASLEELTEWDWTGWDQV